MGGKMKADEREMIHPKEYGEILAIKNRAKDSMGCSHDQAFMIAMGTQLCRIANTLEEFLELIKKDIMKHE